MNWTILMVALLTVTASGLAFAAEAGGENVNTVAGTIAKPGPNDKPIDTGLEKPFEIVDLTEVKGVPCPCGESHRGFVQPDNKVATIHMVDISINAKAHYHKYLTEIYYFLECDKDAKMELNGKLYPVKAGIAVLIKPGTRHRAVGKMKILNVVIPPFDKNDEWFD